MFKHLDEVSRLASSWRRRVELKGVRGASISHLFETFKTLHLVERSALWTWKCRQQPHRRRAL